MRVRGRNGRDCANASVATVRLPVVPDMVCADAAVAANRPSAPAAAKMIVRVILAPLVLRYARPLRTNRQPAMRGRVGPPVGCRYSWSMIFSDLPSPAEASGHRTDRAKGFAQAGNRYPL